MIPAPPNRRTWTSSRSHPPHHTPEHHHPPHLKSARNFTNRSSSANVLPKMTEQGKAAPTTTMTTFFPLCSGEYGNLVSELAN
ncbi:hypothetical protein [Cynomolgus macaque cytomegalovirus strain Mauritius]|uniref:Uncharacterized protein n=1 Tax=Cynomolgus macaque cytomegalovirus strain Mauritius TaxID=1690255 RepID=A0A0K1H0F0_9BETA|nr:hypothetical protein [Cynomolgus macaque cytomegalovirus strain Mauritius]AXG21811.1 hypothetical protein [synthetic construct]AXG22078.1 hypothetical protein [synthetic construct]